MRRSKHPGKRPRYVDIAEHEFGAQLGSRPAIYSEKVSLFIAHKDRHGNLLADVDTWIQRAEVVLSSIGGGATSLLVRGAWLGAKQTPIHEPTTIVYTYADPAAIELGVERLREFAYEYGEATNQGEVAVLLETKDGDWFFAIPFAEPSP